MVSRTNPRSPNFAEPSAAMNRLAGLMSRWMSPAAWMAPRPRAASRRMPSAGRSGSRPPCLSASTVASPPVTSSKAMYKRLPWCTPTSKQVTTLAWLMRPAARASRRKRSV